MPEFDWPSVLAPLAAGEDLDAGAARAAMTEIMEGHAEEAQIAAFIVSLRAKGETVDEMYGLVQAMYDAAVTVDIGVDVVDTAGTGGDRSGTFNISTAAAFIAAGAGARVAKHGNRAMSSHAGSADVLEALGVAIDAPVEVIADMVREAGFGFFFAPRYHPAMRHAGPVRRALGIPTVFNFLGPLVNPARASAQAIGVSDDRMAERMIGVLGRMGHRRALVFHGGDGLDELTTTGVSIVYDLNDGEVSRFELDPGELGIPTASPADLAGGDAAANAAIITAVLDGEHGPGRDIAVLNAAAIVVVAGLAADLAGGVAAAEAAVDDGSARTVLERVVAMSAAAG